MERAVGGRERSLLSKREQGLEAAVEMERERKARTEGAAADAAGKSVGWWGRRKRRAAHGRIPLEQPARGAALSVAVDAADERGCAAGDAVEPAAAAAAPTPRRWPRPRRRCAAARRGAAVRASGVASGAGDADACSRMLRAAGCRSQASYRRQPQPQAISFGKRADADIKPVTITPKSIRGYKLPSSSLLFRSEEAHIVREQALRDEARTLVQKCAEFGVDGQVTQINPGPVVTTFEFRPDAGVKYSRVTGLADDLCLAMAADRS